MKTVVISGAAGTIGNILRPAFARRYHLKSFDCRPCEPFAGEEIEVLDAHNLSAFTRFCQGADVLIHLAYTAPVEMKLNLFPLSIRNIEITYNAYEACRLAGVKRIIFASSNHTVCYSEKARDWEIDLPKELILPEEPARPDSIFGVNKLYGENLGRFYADEAGLSVICLRLGWIIPEQDPREHGAKNLWSKWMSHRDTVQLFQRCIEVEDLDYAVLFGSSANKRCFWDLQRTKKTVGFEPQDDVERYKEFFEEKYLKGK